MQDNFKKIRSILVIIGIFNFIVSFTKMGLGYFTNTNSIFADGLHSLTDGLNNIVGIVALSFAYAPADDEHPYGHKKFETIVSLFIAFLLVMLAYNLGLKSITNFNNNESLNISIYSIIIMIVTMIINIIITRYELKEGQKLNSPFLISDAKHTLSDVYVSLSIIISLIGIKYLNFPSYFDTIMSFMIVFFILKAAYSIIKDAFIVLSDARIFDPEKVSEIVLAFPEVKDTHMIKSRGFADHGYLDLHILVDPTMSIEHAHILNHKIEEKLQAELMNDLSINIHIEPYDHLH